MLGQRPRHHARLRGARAGGVLALAAAGGVVRGDDAVEAEAACWQSYGERFADFAACSGAPTSAFGNGASAPGPEAEADAWMARRFALAEGQHQECGGLGGRYWEVAFYPGAYVESLRLHSDLSGFGVGEAEALKAIFAEFRERLRLLPTYLRSGLCAPATCESDAVRSVVFRRYMAYMLHLDFDLPAPKDWEFEARELAHWADLDLDFAVVGVAHCGTTSLRRNLLRHPEVELTSADEDQWLHRHDRVLPYHGDAEQLQERWRALASGRPPGAPARARGIAEPGYCASARVRQILARHPRMRAVAVVCDPVGQFERHFYERLLCPAAGGRSRARRCWPSLAAALASSPEAMRLPDVPTSSVHLRQLHALLGSRLHVIHQDSLRHDARRTYDGVAAFLGLAPFPPGADFPRHNAAPGHRTDLCRNRSVLLALQRQLLPEYSVLQALLPAAGVPVPASLLQRRTRCDRPEDLSG